MAVRAFEGNYPNIGDAVFIDETAVVIGDVTLAAGVSIWPGAVVRGDVCAITIGAGTNVQDCCVLHGTHDGPYSPGGFPLRIGESVTIGHRAVIHACSVGDYCLIGIGAIIMDGAVVENNVIVGAGGLVPSHKHLDSGFLYVGSPVKKVRPLKDEEFRFLKYSAQHYQKLKNKYIHPE